MLTQQTNFNDIFEIATSCFDKSDKQIESLYDQYPIYRVKSMKGEDNSHAIEVRFEEQNATVAFYLSNDLICESSYLFFDKDEDEELFILFLLVIVQMEKLNENWLLWISRVKIIRAINCLCFHFSK